VTHAGSTEPMGWARVWATAHPFARPLPRAGAWYTGVGEASGERAVLEVRGKRVAILRKLLEIRPKRPEVFTVVVRPHGSGGAAPATGGAALGFCYAVCPACTERVRVADQQTMATCPKCEHRGEIAWWETG
jgi:hypothetical protein